MQHFVFIQCINFKPLLHRKLKKKHHGAQRRRSIFTERCKSKFTQNLNSSRREYIREKEKRMAIMLIIFFSVFISGERQGPHWLWR